MFHQTSFVLYNKLHGIKTDEDIEKFCLMYARNSYKEIINIQIFLADYKISFAYTDTISVSELLYLLESVKDYLKEKNKDITSSLEELQ